jgi:hypothetical protein
MLGEELTVGAGFSNDDDGVGLERVSRDEEASDGAGFDKAVGFPKALGVVREAEESGAVSSEVDSREADSRGGAAPGAAAASRPVNERPRKEVGARGVINDDRRGGTTLPAWFRALSSDGLVAGVEGAAEFASAGDRGDVVAGTEGVGRGRDGWVNGALPSRPLPDGAS